MPVSELADSIGVVGLGLMGTAFTRRFLQFGLHPRVWNRSVEKVQLLAGEGAVPSQNPFNECSTVVICLLFGRCGA